MRPPSYDHEPEKPPSYEDCLSNNDVDSPPAYGVAVIDVPQGASDHPQDSTTNISLREGDELSISFARLSTTNDLPATSSLVGCRLILFTDRMIPKTFLFYLFLG